jgi:hypothetical protein
MKRGITWLAVLAVFFFLAAILAFGQSANSASRPHLIIHHPTNHGGMTAGTVKAAIASSGSGTALPVFLYGVESTRDGNFYSGAIVGKNPFNGGGGTVTVPTQIVPIILHTHTLGVKVSFHNGNFRADGKIFTAPGDATFDPTAPDNNCLTAPNNMPTELLQESPIFLPANFNFGGTHVGTTQYIDAFQRGSFWDVINRSTYHTKLGPVQVLSPLVVDVPANQGLAVIPSVFGTCSNFGIVNLFLIDQIVTSSFGQLASEGVNPGTFPIFMLYNAAMSIGDPTNIFNCCAGGYHNAVATSSTTIQTYSPLDFDTTGVFGTSALDTAIASHEVGEWANDPYVNNPTPAWGHTGQVGGCQNNLEVGDPLTGNLVPLVTMPNGFKYHLQELAFFSWFYGAPSIGTNGWFSDKGTFLTDAGPPCQ